MSATEPSRPVGLRKNATVGSTGDLLRHSKAVSLPRSSSEGQTRVKGTDSPSKTAEPKRPSSILKKVNLQTEDEARLSLKRLSIPDSKSSSLATTPRHERSSQVLTPEIDPMDEGSGEARRNADGTILKLHLLSDDDCEGGSGSESELAWEGGFSGHNLSRGPSIASISSAVSTTSAWRRRSTNAVKATVEEHQQRLIERQQVFSSLLGWANKYGNVTDVDLHIDADQLDLGDEVRKRDKPDPTGVGAALRLHWQQCVQEETEKQLAAVRMQWDEDRRIELDDLKQLREQNNTMKVAISEYKDRQNMLNNKVDLLERQVRGQGGVVKLDVHSSEESNERSRPRSDDGRLPTVVDNEVIGHLKSKLEEAEDALRVADREAQTLHQQLQEAEKRVLAAERAADAAAAAVDEAVALAVEVARAEGKEVPHIEGLETGRRSSSGAFSGGGGRLGASRRPSAGLQLDLEEVSSENKVLAQKLAAGDEMIQRLNQKLAVREESMQELKAEAVKAEKLVSELHAKLLLAEASGGVASAPLNPSTAQSELSHRLQAEVVRLTAEVERLSHEVMTKQPISKQLQIELDLERSKKKELAQAFEEGLDLQLVRLREDALDVGHQALQPLLKEADIRMRQMAKALISQYVPELDTPRGQSASSRRRRLLGKEELKSLLASSTAKLQELMEIGGLSVPAEYLISNLLDTTLDSFNEGYLEAAAAAATEAELTTGRSLQEDIGKGDLEEFSPRIAQLMASRKTARGWKSLQAAVLSVVPSVGSLQQPPGRNHDHLQRLQAPPVPRIRMSRIGEDQPPLPSNRGSARGCSSAQVSARSDGSRGSSDVPVFLLRQRDGVHDGGDHDATISDGAANSGGAEASVHMRPLSVSVVGNEMAVASAKGAFQQGTCFSEDSDEQRRRQGLAPASAPTHEVIKPSQEKTRIKQVPLDNGDDSGGGSQTRSARAIRFSEAVDVVVLDAAPDSPTRDPKGGPDRPGDEPLVPASVPQAPQPDGHSQQQPAASLPRFAPPGERRPPRAQRVSVQTVEAGSAFPPGMPSGLGTRRPEGSFQRLHGAYVNLESMTGEYATGGEAVSQPEAVLRRALPPVPTAARRDHVLERETAEGAGRPEPRMTPERPMTALGGGGDLQDDDDHRKDASGGPSPDMLGPDIAWHPLDAPPPRPKSASQFRRHEAAAGVGRGPSSPQAWSSWSSQEQQQRPRSASAASRERPSSPPKQGPYGEAAYQSPGGYLVRNITATPQKGFTRGPYGRAGAGRPGEGLRATSLQQPQQQQQQGGGAGARWTMGRFVMLEEGQGLPQLPPGPVTFTNVSVSSFNMGLSAPIMSMGMTEVQQQHAMAASAAAPAGGVMKAPRFEDWSVARGSGQQQGRYSTIELMTRVELMNHMRHMQQAHDGVMQRLLMTLQELERIEMVHGELVKEVQESREHWVAENQYNAMLQEELERMRTILTMVSGEAKMPDGEELQQGSRYSSAGEEDN